MAEQHWPDAAVDLATFYAGAGLGLVLNASVCAGSEKPTGGTIAEACVFVFEYGGEMAALDDDDKESPIYLQVLVRAARGGEKAAMLLARRLMKATHLTRTIVATGVEVGDPTVYADAWVLDGSPIDMQKNNNEAPRLVFNVRLLYLA